MLLKQWKIIYKGKRMTNLDFDFCMNCGQMVGQFPVEIPKGE